MVCVVAMLVVVMKSSYGAVAPKVNSPLSFSILPPWTPPPTPLALLCSHRSTRPHGTTLRATPLHLTFTISVSARCTSSTKAISSSADAEKKQSNNVRRSKRKLAAATSSSSNEKKNLFATNLLRTSLLSSLGHVLEQINCGITLEAVLKMGALPEGTALIAGSSMVAACLGKYDWKADVDVYCSAEGAPLVRSVRKYLYTILNITHTL